MHGDADQLVPLARGEEIAALAPGARLVVVPKCGHMLTMEQPAFVNEVLRGWLEEIGA